MKLFKLVASKAGRVVFDDRLQAQSPREAREQMRSLLGLQSLTGVVYAITEIPVELIESIVDARITEAVQRLHSGQPPPSIDHLIRPIAGEEVRQQLASLRDQLATVNRPAADQSAEPASPARFDAFTAASEAPLEERIVGTPRRVPRRRRPPVTINGTLVDWRAVKRLYLRNRSIKQTAAHFELSVNTLKARIRREGWGQ